METPWNPQFIPTPGTLLAGASGPAGTLLAIVLGQITVGGIGDVVFYSALISKCLPWLAASQLAEKN